jgi:hypothetical protein
MQSFKADFRQLEQLDGASLPRPVPIKPAPPRRILSSRERDALASTLDFGKAFSPSLGSLKEVLDIAVSPPAVSVLAPRRMPIGFAFSKSGEVTVAAGITGSAFAAIGISISGGVYASTTREKGTFVTSAGGIMFNVGLSLGPELTFILGTPADLAGPYFAAGVAVSGPSFIGVGGNLLFAPSVPPTIPLTLTLMGFSFSITANTPSPIPTTVVLEVSDTKIWPGLKF